jgi:hypothetical protein
MVQIKNVAPQHAKRCTRLIPAQAYIILPDSLNELQKEQSPA